MEIKNSDLVKPFLLAESHFLQVLLTRFRLLRQPQGVRLELDFDEDTPAIWNRQAKYEIMHRIIGDAFQSKSKEYQERLDAFLVEGRGESLVHDDPGFPFRYANGGTLPVVTVDGREYYCLIYREVFPVGWNIANGGSDRREELFEPDITIERELREELLIVNPQNRKRHVFEGDSGKPLDRPEFAVARKLWSEFLPRLDMEDFGEIITPVKWIPGPDSLVVRFRNPALKEKTAAGYFLNINACDFGIEVDKVALINLNSEDVLIDGEIADGIPINAPVGLFPVDRMTKEAVESGREFLPDFFFFGAKRYEGKELMAVVRDRFIPYSLTFRKHGELDDWETISQPFDFCPVTRRIIRRHLDVRTKGRPEVREDAKIFICFGGEDRNVARKVYDFLAGRRKDVFFSEENYAYDFSVKIDSALISAKALVAVGTNPQHLMKNWPTYEFRSFHNYQLMGKKPDGRLLSFISGFPPVDLPPPLCHYQSVDFSPQDIEEGLHKLGKHLEGI